MNSVAIHSPSVGFTQTKIHPLQALMRAWESEAAEEPSAESEAELMVMLSGMPGQPFQSFDLE